MLTIGPAPLVEGVDAVELDPALVDEFLDRADHAVVLEVPSAACLARKHQHRPAVVAVGDQRQRVVVAWHLKLDMLASHALILGVGHT